MKPKRYVQRKLNFDTYIAHYAFGPDPAEERQRQREEHLKRIHITYQPKTLHPKRVTANPVESEDEPWSIIYVNGKYQPWGNLPETYSGQHEGKSFGQPYVINIGNTMYDPFFEPDWKTKHSKEINDYLSKSPLEKDVSEIEIWIHNRSQYDITCKEISYCDLL